MQGESSTHVSVGWAMSEAERRLLRDLRDAGASGIVASRVGPSRKTTVEALETCGAVRWSSAGRGSRLFISDADAFDRFAQSRFPLGLDYSLDEIDDRASAVAIAGNAKAAKAANCEGLFVRSTKPNMKVVSRDGRVVVPVSDLTATAGGAALLLDDAHEWMFAGSIAVVENAETFWRHDRVMPDIDLAVFSVGTMSSRRVLAWLASLEDCSIVHWGDYDPVGVAEYLRLAVACRGDVTYFMPPLVEQLLPTHGKASLIAEQVEVLDRLRQAQGDETVVRMLELFDKYNRGLEQEILLCEPFAHECRLSHQARVTTRC